MIGKSEILNILSCERVFIAVENWMARCSRTSGLISPQNENLLKLKPAKRFQQMLCFVFLIFLSKMNRQMMSKLDIQENK